MRDEDAWFAAYDAGGVLEWTYVLDTVAQGLPEMSESVEEMAPLPGGAIAVLVDPHHPGVNPSIVLRLDTETPAVPWIHLVDEDHLPTLGGPVQAGYSVARLQHITTSESGTVFGSARLLNYDPANVAKVRVQLAAIDGSAGGAHVFSDSGSTLVAFAREADDLWVEVVRGAGAAPPETWGRSTVLELGTWGSVGSTYATDIFGDPVNFVPFGFAPLGDDAFVSFFHGLVDDPVEGRVERAGVAVISIDGTLVSYTPVDDLARGRSAVADSNDRVFARWGDDPEDCAPQLIQVEPDGALSFRMPRQPGAPAVIGLAIGQGDEIIMLTEGNTLVQACL